MYYYFCGDLNSAKTIVFLHGWGTDSSIFRWVLSFLPQNGFRYLLIDFWGFGKSEEKSCPMSIYDFAEDTKNLLDKLGVDKPVLIGHSFGGRVAIILSSKYKDFVSRVVLVDSAGIIPRRSLNYYLAVMKYKFCKFAVKKGWVKKERLLKYGSEEYKQLSNCMKQTYVNVVNENLVSYVKKIDVGCLILWGENDKYTPLYMAKKINKNVKRSKLIIIKDAGHFCFLDKLEEFVYILYTNVLIKL